ncbi:MAG: response regulator [Flavobacteriaceae bacterium]|nr:response regulator [Flavobacteriaceae bacterium]
MIPIKKYILVDDDPISNMICKMVLKRTLGEVETTAFTEPKEALKFIQNEWITVLEPTILYLDINMPTLSGWEFLEHYEKLGEEVRKKFSIYILSSSVHQHDIDKSKANKHVKGFISKPLQPETVLSVASLKAIYWDNI